MDRSYKEDIPRFRATLEAMRAHFAELPLSTDWNRLRVEPLLEHVLRLDRLLKSPRFARETARLRRGVGMFHADLVYFRTQIKELKEILKDSSQR